AEAGRYFRLALAYAQQPAARLFAVGGLSGSGKSHLALLGCGPERAVIIRSDATRKRLAASHADLPLYGEAMTDLTYQSMFSAARDALAAGLSVILDATFLDPAHRNEVRALARETGAPSTFFWLDIPEQHIRRQIADRCASGRDISDADMAVLEAQLKHYKRPAEADITFLSRSDSWPHQSPGSPEH
ncbi:MAG: ATP-binding protein, partial [Mariprofundaceae bacterium]